MQVITANFSHCWSVPIKTELNVKRHARSLKLVEQWQQGLNDIDCSDFSSDRLKQCSCGKHNCLRLTGVWLQAIMLEPVTDFDYARCELAHC
jgi:hypothetical protein